MLQSPTLQLHQSTCEGVAGPPEDSSSETESQATRHSTESRIYRRQQTTMMMQRVTSIRQCNERQISVVYALQI